MDRQGDVLSNFLKLLLLAADQEKGKAAHNPASLRCDRDVISTLASTSTTATVNINLNRNNLIRHLQSADCSQAH